MTAPDLDLDALLGPTGRDRFFRRPPAPEHVLAAHRIAALWAIGITPV